MIIYDIKTNTPKKDGYYLVLAPLSFPNNCRWLVAEYCEGDFYSEANDKPLPDVTHWCELPSEKISNPFEWKPIDTAPKDGTSILVCNFDYYYPETASYSTYHPNAKGKCTWRNASGIKINPTHWMPLFEKP